MFNFYQELKELKTLLFPRQSSNDEELEENKKDEKEEDNDCISIGTKLSNMPFSNNTFTSSLTSVSLGSPGRLSGGGGGGGSTVGSATPLTISSSSISSINLISSGAGYVSSPAITLSGLGIYSGATGITGAKGATGATGATGLYSQTVFNSDVILISRDGTQINLGDTLRAIIDQSGFIIPNYKLIDKYPSLTDAWSEYKSEVQKNLKSPELQSAIENYKMIASIVKASDEGGD